MKLVSGGIVLAALLAAVWIAVAQTGRSVPDLYQESYVLEAEGKHKAALKAIEGVLERDPRDYVAQLRAGWLAYLAGDNQRSADAYGKAVKLEPGAVEPRLGLMLPLMAAGRNKEALAAADELLAIDARSYLGASRKAFLLYTLGRFAKAEEQYRAVLALYPSDVEMMAGLAWSQLQLGKKAEARATFERLLRVAPKHVTGREGYEQAR
jgi:tetratricopeptide (TPR) repeat protein